MNPAKVRLLLCVVLCAASCSPMKELHKLDNASFELGLFLPGEDSEETTDNTKKSEVSVRKSTKEEEIYVMHAEKDENGEYVATEKIDAATVTARFRNKAEHFGMIDLEFLIVVPGTIVLDDMRVTIQPEMYVLGDTVYLQKFHVTGKNFRDRQQKGRDLYEKFVGKIVADTTEFLHRRQFEGFLERNLPQVYALKDSDEDYTESQFQAFFDVDAKEALDHYLDKSKIRKNHRRINSKDLMFEKYCPYDRPQVTADVLFDTTWTQSSDFVYLYKHSIRTRPKMKKIDVIISGEVNNYDDEFAIEMQKSLPLSFYVSSISALTRDEVRTLRNGQIDENYAEGLQALKDMDYEKAGKILRKYKDYNAALAMLAIDNNYTAEDILNRLPKTADVYYLLAIVNSRFGREKQAVDCYIESCNLNGMFVHRGNLDPEILGLIKKYDLDKVLNPDNYLSDLGY